MVLPHFGAVSQQQRGILQHGLRSSRVMLKRWGLAYARKLRIVWFSRSDSRNTMFHQLRLLAVQRQLLAEDLHRAGNRRQRVADLVGNPRRHLADGRQPLLHARVALQTPDRCDVLEREEEAGDA